MYTEQFQSTARRTTHRAARGSFRAIRHPDVGRCLLYAGAIGGDSTVGRNTIDRRLAAVTIRRHLSGCWDRRGSRWRRLMPRRCDRRRVQFFTMVYRDASRPAMIVYTIQRPMDENSDWTAHRQAHDYFTDESYRRARSGLSPISLSLVHFKSDRVGRSRVEFRN